LEQVSSATQSFDDPTERFNLDARIKKDASARQRDLDPPLTPIPRRQEVSEMKWRLIARYTAVAFGIIFVVAAAAYLVIQFILFDL
jgi:hypothetical protein